jgi:hypothetical protein
MMQIFDDLHEQSLQLHVVREAGTSTFYFAYPTPTLKQGKVHAVMRKCLDCSVRHGAQLQSMVTSVLSPADRTVPHIAVRILAWRRHEKDLEAEVSEILRGELHAQVLPVYRC